METETVHFIRKRNYRTIAKDKVVRLRSWSPPSTRTV